MRRSDPHYSARFRLALGALIAVAVVPVALADTEEVADIPDAPISMPEAAAPPVSMPEAVAVPLTGRQVYSDVCIACHAPPGIGGAPALGDRDAWAARIAQGKDTLVDHALHGFSGRTGIMPMKGGRLDLSDEEIIAAVEYLIEKVAE